MKILVADSIAEEGIQSLRSHAQVDIKTKLAPEQLKAIIGDYDGLVIRSATKVTAEIIEAAEKLKVPFLSGWFERVV